MRRAGIALCLLIGLSGCTYLFEPPPNPRAPERYGTTLAGAQSWLNDVRAAWVYKSNSYVQDPADSLIWLSGDCDDFAVLAAYWIQTYWGCDTFVTCLDSRVSYKEDHAVCYVRADHFPPASPIYGLTCPNSPWVTMISTGVLYRPLDWAECPDWTWNHYNIGKYHLNLTTGRVEWCEILEWYEATHYYMSVSTGLSGIAESFGTCVFPVSIANIAE